jgi:cytochrome c
MHRILLSAGLALAVSLSLELPLGLPAAAQDATAGQRVFRAQCGACHNADPGGRNGVGPNLHGIVGRRAASAPGFAYSPGMKAKGEEGFAWTEDKLRPYITNPRAVVPQGTMPYAGLRNEQQLNDLLAYLKAQG